VVMGFRLRLSVFTQPIVYSDHMSSDCIYSKLGYDGYYLVTVVILNYVFR